MYRKFLNILNSFGVHMIWLISVLSLMPKGEIFGIKLVLPIVTTLSNITDSTRLCSDYRVMQCLPGYAVSTRLCSVYRVMQCSPSTVKNTVFTKYNTECSVHRVTSQDAVITEEQYQPSEFPSPSLQWLLSLELLKAVSMDRAFTSTECMTMPGNAMDAEYQKVTESVH